MNTYYILCTNMLWNAPPLNSDVDIYIYISQASTFDQLFKFISLKFNGIRRNNLP